MFNIVRATSVLYAIRARDGKFIVGVLKGFVACEINTNGYMHGACNIGRDKYG